MLRQPASRQQPVYQAKPRAEAVLPPSIRNRLAQSGHVSVPEVKAPQSK